MNSKFHDPLDAHARSCDDVATQDEPTSDVGHTRGRPRHPDRLEPFAIRLGSRDQSRIRQAALLANAESTCAWAREVLGAAAKSVVDHAERCTRAPVSRELAKPSSFELVDVVALEMAGGRSVRAASRILLQNGWYNLRHGNTLPIAAAFKIESLESIRPYAAYVQEIRGLIEPAEGPIRYLAIATCLEGDFCAFEISSQAAPDWRDAADNGICVPKASLEP